MFRVFFKQCINSGVITYTAKYVGFTWVKSLKELNSIELAQFTIFEILSVFWVVDRKPFHSWIFYSGRRSPDDERETPFKTKMIICLKDILKGPLRQHQMFYCSLLIYWLTFYFMYLIYWIFTYLLFIYSRNYSFLAVINLFSWFIL